MLVSINARKLERKRIVQGDEHTGDSKRVGEHEQSQGSDDSYIEHRSQAQDEDVRRGSSSRKYENESASYAG